MSFDPETTRIVRSWMNEGVTRLPDRVLDAVLDQVPATPQRRAGWPARRTPTMNRILGFSLAAAAVVAIVLIGAQLLGSPGGRFGEPGDDPTPTPDASIAEPSVAPSVSESTRATEGLPEGPFVVNGTGDPVQVTVTIASSGWVPLRVFDAVTKEDDGLDPPETVGAALQGSAFPAGTGFNVYGDPCQWTTSIPETPATTPDEIAAALAAQASRDATAPVDVTVGGYAGKMITLHVPMTFEVANATREEEFAACDNDVFATYGLESNETEPERTHQGPGQIDELWILDVGGSIVILDAMYGPATPAYLVEEMRSMAESATFELP